MSTTFPLDGTGRQWPFTAERKDLKPGDIAELPKLNTSELKELLSWARKSELGYETEVVWDQDIWIVFRERHSLCGAYACIAGKAALDDGWILKTDRDGFRTGGLVYKVVEGERESSTVAWAAEQSLGLTGAEADELFDGGNELSDIENIVEACIHARQAQYTTERKTA